MSSLIHISPVLSLLLVLGSTGRADASGKGAGFVLLREGVGARAEAMGGAYTAVARDQTAAAWNPAGIGALTGKDFLVTHHSSFQEIQQIYGGWAYGNGRSGVALSLGIYSVGGIEARTGPSAQPQGTFGIYEIIAGLTYAKRIKPGFYAGATVRALHESIGPEQASGFSVDLGLLYRFGMKGLIAGASYRNLGRMEVMDTQRTPLPGTFRAGIAWRAKWLTGSLDLSAPRHGSVGVHTGVELRVKGALCLRAGYRTGHDIRDWSFGFGIQPGSWRMEYAYVPAALGLDGSHRLEFGIR
ncbi:MAG: PorV/PorQ family protein [Gemmatimonadetes bacterium]|nr:PorV/PorQ family protein [Gemmatimonadota bacterium]